MKKKFLAFVLAAIMILGFMPQSAKADDPEPATVPTVTVYLSISNDAQYANTASSNGYNGQSINPTVMAMKEIEVPYFDLSLYGLQAYYFSETNYGPEPDWPSNTPGVPGMPKSELEPGTSEYAEGFITMLHVMIYAMEVYYYGVPESLAGKGWLYQNNKLGTSDINIGGTVGSLFFWNYWGFNYNFNYYRNYDYPLASAGWGATADQIRVYNGDILTVGHFTDSSFFTDDYSVFAYAQPDGIDLDNNDPELTVSPVNNSVELVFGHAGLDMYSFTDTAHTAFDIEIPVYYKAVNSISSGDVTTWTYLGTTDTSGAITINTSLWGSGTYLVATPGYRSSANDPVTCSPGGILVVKN
jgi:hypothetical protein